MIIACPVCAGTPKAQSFNGRFGFSPREAEVANLILEGNRTESICNQLGISESTTKRHLKNAMRKAGVTSRIGLVRVAFGMEAV